jgi:hypothetical protein
MDESTVFTASPSFSSCRERFFKHLITERLTSCSIMMVFLTSEVGLAEPSVRDLYVSENTEPVGER